MQRRRKYRTKRRIKTKNQRLSVLVLFVFFAGTIALVGYNFRTGVFSLSSMMKLGATSYTCKYGTLVGTKCKYLASSADRSQTACNNTCKNVAKNLGLSSTTASWSGGKCYCIYNATSTCTGQVKTRAEAACNDKHRNFDSSTCTCKSTCKSGYKKDSSGNCVSTCTGQVKTRAEAACNDKHRNFDSSTCTCKSTCKNGYKKDSSGNCVSTCTGQAKTRAQAECESQHKNFDSSTCTCKSTCVDGYTKNSSGTCVKKCSVSTAKTNCDNLNRQYDTTKCECTTTCKTGYTWDKTAKTCCKTSDIDSCNNKNMKYNNKTCSCTNTCKDGYTKNSSGNCVKKSSSTTNNSKSSSSNSTSSKSSSSNSTSSSTSSSNSTSSNSTSSSSSSSNSSSSNSTSSNSTSSSSTSSNSSSSSTTTDSNTSTTTTTNSSSSTDTVVQLARSSSVTVSIKSNVVGVKVKSSVNGIKSIQLRETNSDGEVLVDYTNTNKKTKSYTISSDDLKLPESGKSKKYWIKVTDLSGLTTYKTFMIKYSSSGKYSMNSSPAQISKSTSNECNGIYLEFKDSNGVDSVTYQNSDGEWIDANIADYTAAENTKTNTTVITNLKVFIPYEDMTKKSGDYYYVYVKSTDAKGYMVITTYRTKLVNYTFSTDTSSCTFIDEEYEEFLEQLNEDDED